MRRASRRRCRRVLRVDSAATTLPTANGCECFRAILRMHASPAAPARARTCRAGFHTVVSRTWVLEQEKDRKRVVEGKSVSVRVDRGGGRIFRKKKKEQ